LAGASGTACSTSIFAQTENVDPRPVAVSRPPLITVQHHIIVFGDHAPELDVFAWMLLGHPQKVVDKSLLPVRHRGIVLDVDFAGVLCHRLGGLRLVEHRIVESRYVSFVAP
jgi:hypothetical protein